MSEANGFTISRKRRSIICNQGKPTSAVCRLHRYEFLFRYSVIVASLAFFHQVSALIRNSCLCSAFEKARPGTTKQLRFLPTI